MTRIPSVSPLLFCEDAAASQDFLVKAFGLERGDMHRGPDGTAVHATVRLGDDTVFLSRPHPGTMEPAKSVPTLHALVMVYVEDVDAFFDRAKAAGATVGYEPQDMPYGQRECGLRDLDGHYWSIATPLPGAG